MKKMNKVFDVSRKFIKGIDIFGTPITFNIDGQATYQSAVGGLMTLLMITIIITFFQSQVSDFLNMDKIYVETQQSFNSNPGKLTLQQKDFMFAIGIEQTDAYPFSTHPFFSIEMLQNEYIHNGTIVTRSNKTIPLEVCTLDRFLNFNGTFETPIKTQYENYGFGNFLCPTANFSFDLEGSFLNKFFSFVTIRITECVDSNTTTCAPQSVREEYLMRKGAFRLSFYTTNYVVNPENRTDFTQLYIAEDLTFQFQPGYVTKVANIFFRNYHVDTDNSIFRESGKLDSKDFIFRGESSSTVQANDDLISQSYQLTKNEKKHITRLSALTLYLRSDNISLIARRKFMRVDELLSYFGGIFQLFFLVIGFFMAIYNKNFFLLHLANKLYNFKESDQHYKKSNRDEQTKKIDDLVNTANMRLSQKHQVKEMDIQIEMQQENDLINLAKLSDVTDMNKIKELGFKSRNAFLMWYFEKILLNKFKLRASLSYVLYFISFTKLCSNNRNRLIDKAIIQVSKDMNIKNLMNQIQQIDKLKRLLLDKHQIILFNFFPKIEINLLEEKAFNINNIDNDDASVDSKNTEIKMMRKKTPKSKTIKIAVPTLHKKTNIDYEQFQTLLSAFDQIMTTESTDETTQMINTKLIHFLGTELRTIFKTSLLIQNLDQDDFKVGLLQRSIVRDNFDKVLKDEEEELRVIKTQYLQSKQMNQVSQLLNINPL